MNPESTVTTKTIPLLHNDKTQPTLRPSSKLTVLQLLKPHWKPLILALVAIAGAGVADILEPWPLKMLLDYVVGSKRPPEWLTAIVHATFGQGEFAFLNFTILSVLLIAVSGAVSSYVEKYMTTSIGQWVMHDMRRTLYYHIQRLSLSFHDQKRTGDLISRVTSDIDAIQSFITSALLEGLVNVLTLVGMIAVMFYLNWKFTLIALTVTPILFVVVYSFTHRIKKASHDVRKKESQVVSIIEEVLSSMRVVKAFAREDYEQQRFEQESLESVETALKARSLKAKLTPVVEIIVAAGTCLVLWYGTRLVLSGQISSGVLVVFFLYLGKLYKPMRELSKMTDTFSKAAVGFERIQEVLNTEGQVRDLANSRKAPPLKGAVDFVNVQFGYSDDQMILKDVSFSIKPGQVAAFVGPTGTGKSTIISLIPRFYDPVSGQVKLDGIDVRSFKQRSLRQQISFVLQDTLLFHASILQNIAYGKPEATREEVIKAAKLANAHEFIERMPEGYDTKVGERGVTLSGGQRQRVAIARAIIRNSPILILDEPTSGLDAASEEIVFEALNRLMKGKTCIVIAHRLATIQHADIIFVLKEGKIVEQGKHQELMEQGGLYAKLHEIQFRVEDEKPQP